jgi:hypothetical protein
MRSHKRDPYHREPLKESNSVRAPNAAGSVSGSSVTSWILQRGATARAGRWLVPLVPALRLSAFW